MPSHTASPLLNPTITSTPQSGTPYRQKRTPLASCPPTYHQIVAACRYHGLRYKFIQCWIANVMGASNRK